MPSAAEVVPSVATPAALVVEVVRDLPEVLLPVERGRVRDVVVGEVERLRLEQVLRVAEMGPQLIRSLLDRLEHPGERTGPRLHDRLVQVGVVRHRAVVRVTTAFTEFRM